MNNVNMKPMKNVNIKIGRLTAANQPQAIKQKGAVLIITLLLMTVMTLMSVSGMESSIMNEMMASNLQYKEVAFQAADSGASYAIAQTSWVNATLALIDRANPDWPQYSVDINDLNSSTTVTMSASNGPMPGNSIRMGGAMVFINLETDSSATSYVNVSTNVVKGYARAGAGG